MILGQVDPSTINDPVYFMTDDEISRGENQISYKDTQYASVVQPNHIETVIANLPTGPRKAMQTWKYSRYFDNPQF